MEIIRPVTAVGPGTLRVITDLDSWDRQMPVALIATAMHQDGRRALLARLAARALGCRPSAVSIQHRRGREPRLIAPPGSSVHLSSSSRDGVVALAASREPVGIDVERVDPSGPVPWNVLHPAEADWLSGQVELDRAERFARIWSAKEAYLKALGLGLGREPSSFVALPRPGDAIGIVDGAVERVARTTVLAERGSAFVVALVVIGDVTVTPETS